MGRPHQIVEAFADREASRYLIRDRDGVYGNDVRRRLESLGNAEVLTAPQRPGLNAYVERLIGSIRREYLNHLIVLNARHPKVDVSSVLSLLPPISSSFGAGQTMPD